MEPGRPARALDRRARSGRTIPGGLSLGLAPLRRRDFSLLWAGGLVSIIGSWMQTVAVGALVTAKTGEATWAVIVAAGAFLPIGLLSPIGGALADRLPRRQVLMGGNLLEAVVAGLLAIAVSAGSSAPVITLLVTIQGCISALILPFEQAILPDLVPRDELLAGASLNSAQWNLGRVVGPALAGATVAAFGYPTAFVANAVSFLAVVAALAFVRLPPPRHPATTSLRQQITDGARAARAEPTCRAAIGMIAVIALTASPFIALVPAVARHLVTHNTGRQVAKATAVLTTAQGVGAVLGALTLAALAHRFGRGRIVIGAMVLLPLVVTAYAAAPTLLLATIGMGLLGCTYIWVLSGMSTAVQLFAPPAFRGRILSLYMVALGVLYPIGALVQGPLADHFGLAQTTAGAAAVLGAVLIVVAVGRPSVLTALGRDYAKGSSNAEAAEAADAADGASNLA